MTPVLSKMDDFRGTFLKGRGEEEVIFDCVVLRLLQGGGLNNKRRDLFGIAVDIQIYLKAKKRRKY